MPRLPRLRLEELPSPPPPLFESYVVLLSNDDGSAGKVQLTTPAGMTQLDTHRQGSNSRIEASKITIESHGEKNLRVPTPDGTSEARNRRVKVTVR